jgi:hypothetical protein
MQISQIHFRMVELVCLFAKSSNVICEANIQLLFFLISLFEVVTRASEQWATGHPVGGEMFIAWGPPHQSTAVRRGGTQLDRYHLVTFRPSERRNGFFYAQGYKHLTPTEWRACFVARLKFLLVAALTALRNLWMILNHQ